MDVAYRDLASMISCGTLLFTNDPIENINILEEVFLLINITKGDLDSQEIELYGSRIYLIYLIQSKNSIPLGLCPRMKVWFNKIGVQSRCQYEERLIPVQCNGDLRRCSIPANKPKP